LQIFQLYKNEKNSSPRNLLQKLIQSASSCNYKVSESILLFLLKHNTFVDFKNSTEKQTRTCWEGEKFSMQKYFQNDLLLHIAVELCMFYPETHKLLAILYIFMYILIHSRRPRQGKMIHLVFSHKLSYPHCLDRRLIIVWTRGN
jgi:hypothetical protein